jgi:hypothetical protein
MDFQLVVLEHLTKTKELFLLVVLALIVLVV